MVNAFLVVVVVIVVLFAVLGKICASQFITVVLN